jgi:pyrroloquinoline quinone biosynthesis protein B
MNASPAVRILGSAAGGGYPQWNCRCPVCELAWAGDEHVAARTQSSLAATASGREWVLINASPDIRQQIIDHPPLRPRTGVRDSPIVSIVLTNADIDHIAGLLVLRERWPLKAFATPQVLYAVAANPIFEALARDMVERVAVELDRPFRPAPGIEMILFSVPGKVPLWGEKADVATDVDDGRTVGVEIGLAGRRIHYVPGCAAMTDALRKRLTGSALTFFDGTLFADDEMVRLGLGPKTGRRMGHMPVSGPGGSLEAFARLDVARKVYVHINNSNPMLVDGSPERRQVEAAGWTVGADGMEFTP